MDSGDYIRSKQAAVTGAMELLVLSIQLLDRQTSIPVGMAMLSDETGAWRSYVARCRVIGQAVSDHVLVKAEDVDLVIRLRQRLQDVAKQYQEAVTAETELMK